MSRAAVSRSSFDFSGTATLAAAMLGFVYTDRRSARRRLGAGQTLLSFAAVGMLLAAFVLIEERANPLVRLGILRSTALRRANYGAMALLGSVAWVPVHRHPLHAEPRGAGRRSRWPLPSRPQD